MRIVDLSHPLGPDMPLYPGTPPPRLEPSRHLATDGFREHVVTLTTHVGTHLDAPAHLLAGGGAVDGLPVDRCVGRAAVLDPGPLEAGRVTVARLDARRDQLAGADAVLLRTGWSRHWGSPAYFEGFPCLAPDAARWLVDHGVRLVGVDAVSVDPMGDEDLAVHRTLLAHDVVIVENLANLAALPAAGFLICALPLPLPGADGSPVRAVAILD